jgi:hypothetical protein
MQGKFKAKTNLRMLIIYNFRLPNFPITDAVDALTLGSVNFLPERISVC